MFPATRRSVLLAARDADPEVRRRALGTLTESYWKPIYKYLRVHHRAEGEEARDLTQGFFAWRWRRGPSIVTTRSGPGSAPSCGWRSTASVAAYRESLVERAGRFIHRHRTPILIVLAYLVMRALLILILGR